jgi:hypothetical protein
VDSCPNSLRLSLLNSLPEKYIVGLIEHVLIHAFIIQIGVVNDSDGDIRKSQSNTAFHNADMNSDDPNLHHLWS